MNSLAGISMVIYFSTHDTTTRWLVFI